MQAATAGLTPARALRRPRRVDLRVLVGLGLALLAFSGSLAFWAAASDTRAVVVATRSLPPGATIATSDLTVARVHMDERLYVAAVPADALASLVGKELSQPIYADQVLAQGQVLGNSRPAVAADQMALTIPVSPSTAAGGQVRPGDSVQVIATTNKGKPEAETSVVLDRVVVYEVGRDQQMAVVSTAATGDSSAGGVSHQGPVSSLTLVVSQEQAVQLAKARWNGDLDVALLPPQPQR